MYYYISLNNTTINVSLNNKLNCKIKRKFTKKEKNFKITYHYTAQISGHLVVTELCSQQGCLDVCIRRLLVQATSDL